MLKKIIIVFSAVILNLIFFTTNVSAEENILVDESFIEFVDDAVNDPTILIATDLSGNNVTPAFF